MIIIVIIIITITLVKILIKKRICFFVWVSESPRQQLGYIADGIKKRMIIIIMVLINHNK